MSTVSGSTNYISGYIVEIKQELARKIAQLEDLQQLVLSTEQEVEQLKGRLIQHELAKTLSTRTIDRCPPEILSIIFKYFILDQPSHVRRLLLVCRRWYDLVVQDPQMWNIIRVTVPEQEWNIESWKQSIQPFIKTCLERSRSAHLQVDLDFTNLQGPREQIMDKLDQGFWKSSEEAALEDGDALLLEWLGSLDYDDILDQEFVAKCVPDHVFCLIDLIVGQDGRNMERWQSLKIAFPIAPELSLLIWPKLMRPTPSLSDIQFIHSGHLRDLGSNDPLPFFESTQCARVGDFADWHTFSRMFPTSLRELTVGISSELAFFRGLTSFTNLTKLCVKSIFGTIDGVVGDCAISLPVLREFQLVGKFSSVLEKIEFHFPTLEEFVLEWGAYVHVQTKPWLPAVHASRLRWNVGNTPIDLITDVSKGVLRTILHRYTNTKGLCVPAFVKTVLLGLLKEIFDDGILCNSWEVVSFHDMSGILETVRVKDIVGSRK